MGSLASTWWGWLVRDGSGGSFFQWVRLLLSTARRVLAEEKRRGRVGTAARPPWAQPTPGQPPTPQCREAGDGASAHLWSPHPRVSWGRVGQRQRPLRHARDLWPLSRAAPRQGAGPGPRRQSWTGWRGREEPERPEGSELARRSPVLPRPVHVLVLLHALGVGGRHVDDVALGERRQRGRDPRAL